MLEPTLYIGHVPGIIKVLLVVVAIVALYELRRRDTRSRSAEDAEALAVLEDVQKTLVRLEERMDNLETLLPGTSGPNRGAARRSGSPGASDRDSRHPGSYGANDTQPPQSGYPGKRGQ
ncbi:hypothetical protein [Solidesulfovibrio aerotolerans]|uniref:hypothetical protein n=1 Tax=Solidesulfovibrio aerotolerans TaxID=295255 RepID=UPI001BA64742|nr:hypothetical protein [Solidesulfovibrio aerotolerans]